MMDWLVVGLQFVSVLLTSFMERIKVGRSKKMPAPALRAVEFRREMPGWEC